MKLKAMLTGMLCCVLSLAGYGQPDPFYVPDVLYVKMKDDAGYRLYNGQLIATRKNEEPVLKDLAALGSWSRLHEVANDKLAQWRREAQANLKQNLPDLSMEFYFRVNRPEDRNAATDLLQQLADAENILRVPVMVPAPLPGDFTPQQLYGQTVETGINADSVYLVFQNKGAGIKVCDIEYDFHAAHADLPVVTLIGGVLGRKQRLLAIPRGLLKMMARAGDLVKLPLNSEKLKKLTENYVVSNRKIKQVLGIPKMPVSAADGLRKTIESFRSA